VGTATVSGSGSPSRLPADLQPELKAALPAAHTPATALGLRWAPATKRLAVLAKAVATALERTTTGARRRAAGTRSALLRLVDSQSSATQLLAIKLGDGCRHLIRLGKLDEGEAARLAGIPILGYVHIDDLSHLGHGFPQVLVGRLEVEITDEYLLTGNNVLLSQVRSRA